MLYPPGFYYVKKPKRFVILSTDNHSERNLSCFFDIKKPSRIEHLQSKEPFSSDPYFKARPPVYTFVLLSCFFCKKDKWISIRKLENQDTSEIVVVKNRLQKDFVPIVRGMERKSSKHTRALETIFVCHAKKGEKGVFLLCLTRLVSRD